jgi:fimbrial chaperone protein
MLRWLLVLLMMLTPAVAAAASLQVTPVTVDLNGGRKAATLTLTNVDAEPINVQARVFRWTRVNGEEKLEPTTDVVASPPMTRMAPGAVQTIRVVRVSNTPGSAEESYRILIDELPDPARQRAGEVGMVLRQSIPIFFTQRAGVPQVTWRVEPGAGGHELVARNTGARRLRLANLQLKSGTGAVVFTHPGLSGYVLAGGEMRWPLPAGAAGAGLTLSAASDLGVVNVVLAPPS